MVGGDQSWSLAHNPQTGSRREVGPVWATMASAGGFHTVLLRSDGCAVACGRNIERQCDIPALVKGISYVQVSGGQYHTVLLQSDVHVGVCGSNDYGQCNVPDLDEDTTYLHISAGAYAYCASLK